MNDRPRLKINKDGFMHICEAIAALCVIGSWVLAIYYYSFLPTTIPIHFDGAGNANGFGAKEIIFLLPCIATVLIFGIYWLSKYPHLFNYMRPVTNDNAEQMYTAGVKTLCVVNAITSVILFLAVSSTINAALATDGKLSKWMLPIIMGLSAILVIYSIVGAVKSAKNK